jgi:hypothetical protein
MSAAIIGGVFTLLGVALPVLVTLAYGPRRQLLHLKAELELLQALPTNFAGRDEYAGKVESDFEEYFERGDLQQTKAPQKRHWYLAGLVSYALFIVLTATATLGRLLGEPDPLITRSLSFALLTVSLFLLAFSVYALFRWQKIRRPNI